MATNPARRGWSYAEFSRLPDDGNRYEIIDGEVYVTPAPRSQHQQIIATLVGLMINFAWEHDLGWVLPGPIDVLFADGDYLEPDLIFVRRDRGEIISERGAEAAPDLVVEVLSDSTAFRDRGIKRERYAHFGVPEYWIIDERNRRVEIFRIGEPPVTVTDELTWQPIPGGPELRMSLSKLLRGFV
ncbi:MAG TPA: Uma2 family endonuclease [Longimicrobium sp.]